MLCQDCDKRATCTEICPEVENYLKKHKIWSSKWIRPKISTTQQKKERKNGIFYGQHREIPFSSLITEDSRHPDLLDVD